MSVLIKGKTIKWGIPAGAKTAADALVAGIVEDVKIAIGGNTSEIVDEDGDIVTRVGHGKKNTVTIQTKVTATNPALPAKDDSVTFSAAIDGVPLNTGRAFVDTAEITYKGNDATTVSITIHHYPDMPADG
jgi:hypothetical protein